jgi:hypothetical protein
VVGEMLEDAVSVAKIFSEFVDELSYRHEKKRCSDPVAVT